MPTTSLAALALSAALSTLTLEPAPPVQTQPSTGVATMTQHAKGPFEVKMAPQDQDAAEGTVLARLSLDKVFHGALEATGKGQMLTASTDTPGSAVYVAIERVTGTLEGKAGSFALVHRGLMRGEERNLSVEIVPDSGTGALKGISGRLNIEVADGKHLYDLEYTLPAS
jgi:hypothetical protein